LFCDHPYRGPILLGHPSSPNMIEPFWCKVAQLIGLLFLCSFINFLIFKWEIMNLHDLQRRKSIYERARSIYTTEWLINPVSSWDSSIDYTKCPWLTFYIVSFYRCCKAENHIFMIFKGWLTSLDNLCFPWKPNDVSSGV